MVLHFEARAGGLVSLGVPGVHGVLRALLLGARGPVDGL